MTLRSNLNQFRNEALAIADAVSEEWRLRAVRLSVYALGQLVENTEDSGSVDTGAYRAEHTVTQEGGFVFEHPDRPGPDQPFESRKRRGEPPIFEAPDLDQAAREIESRLGVGDFAHVNRRFYADSLENGSASIEPRQIYARAADATEAFAESLAVEPFTMPVLERNR